tara:strand:- start:238 stop:903 length:666 start_codon:yes stop_codon:yes gene_type:complete
MYIVPLVLSQVVKILTKENTMKIVLLNILFISAIFAQNGLTVVGGLNQSNQTFEEDDVGDENINYLNGYNLTVEKSFGIAKFGVGLNQRGVKLNAEESDMGLSLDMEAELTLNYLTLHAVYPYAIQEKITVFGGVQLGKGLGGEANMKISMSFLGETESSDDSEDIDAEDMELEYGLFLGGDYMINEKIGVRASYFKGLSDIAEDDETKNNTISVSLLFKL